MHRRQEMSQVTEDDVNEVKGDISTLRFELLDVFKNNGMDISTASKNTKGIKWSDDFLCFELFLADYIFDYVSPLKLHSVERCESGSAAC